MRAAAARERAGSLPRSVSLDFRSGVDAKDFAQIAKNEHLEPLEGELRRLEEVLREVQGDLTYAQQREETHRNTSESTNARVLWFSVATMVVLLATCFVQLLYLQRYFSSKKLI